MTLACQLFVLSVTAIAGSYAGLRRDVTSVDNPDCNDKNNSICTTNPTNISLVYTKALASNLNSSSKHWDEMNYLWSTIDHPTVIVSHTTEKQAFSVNWTKNVTSPIESIQLNGSFSMAVVLSNIYTFKMSKLEFNHTGLDHNTSKINCTIDPTKIKWDKFDNSSGTFHGTCSMAQCSPKCKALNGTVSLDLKCLASPSEGEQSAFPHLPLSANTTLIEIDLKLNASPTVKDDDSIALELVVVPGPGMGDQEMSIKRKRTVDDEYTPSTFYSYVMNIMNKGTSNGGFIQWKPIVYTDKDKTVQNSELVYVQQPKDNNHSVIPWLKKVPSSIVDSWYKGSGMTMEDALVFYIVYHPQQSGATGNPTYFSW